MSATSSGEGLYHVLGLEDVIRLCVEHRVARCKAGGIEVEMHPSAWASPADDKLLPDEDVCPCGHSLVVEHGTAGCLHGCSLDLCASKGGA